MQSSAEAMKLDPTLMQITHQPSQMQFRPMDGGRKLGGDYYMYANETSPSRGVMNAMGGAGAIFEDLSDGIGMNN